MRPKEEVRWARTRAKGRVYFIWVTGVIRIGLFMALALVWGTFLIFGWDGLTARSVPALIVSPIFGYFWARRLWDVRERHYSETMNKDAKT